MPADRQQGGIGIPNPFYGALQLGQRMIDKALSPRPPDSHHAPGRPKVAVIGAGITGVTAAAHCIGHGFDVVIFEAGTAENLGGIWSVSNPYSTMALDFS